MARWRYAVVLGLLVLSGAALGGRLLPTVVRQPDAGEEKPGSARPRLAVLVVFDQMRGDYLQKWKHLFEKDGFGKLQSDGAWFTDCHYPYALTLTAAGHASMATGCAPDKHAVIANSWYDRELGKDTAATAAPRFPHVPTGKGDPGAAPVRLRQPTIGDALLEQTKGKGKVVSLSIKDRGAIFLAALLRLALALWLGPDGDWVTSTYYRDALPGWVTKINKTRPADRWFGKEWHRLRADLTYDFLSGPDDFAFEGIGYKQGRTFPHPISGGLEKPGEDYYDALAASPFGNELLLELAKAAIEHEQLGRDDVPDLLTISFSCNDYIGHCWGPDSQEVLDVTLRSDLLVKDLLGFLDAKVGKGKYLLVVCSDHGICPLPEVMRAKGYRDVGRIDPAQLGAKAQALLNEKFGGGKELPWIEKLSSGMIYLNRGVIKSQAVSPAEVEKTLADWIVTQPGFQAAYTRSQLAAGQPVGERIGRMIRRSFHPANSGDVIPVLKPYWLPVPWSEKKNPAFTTTHGSPHDYDTHVPLLVYGPNVIPGVRRERVTPLAVAAILARGLGIDPPRGAEEDVPTGLLK